MNVLIIGLGSIGKKHVDSLFKIDKDINIYALRRFENCETYKHVQNITNYLDIIEIIDFIIISNITSSHFDTILEFSKFKIPLFIEKPLIHELKGILKLKKEINEKEIITYVACNLRFHPVINYLQKKILPEITKINEIYVYCGSYLPDWRPGSDFKNSYSSNKKMGGGVHLDLIHELDYCYWLFGKPEKLNSYKFCKSHLNINSIDSVNYLLDYNDFNIKINLNYFRRDSKRYLEILTDNDTIYCDLINNKISSFSKNYEVKFDKINTYDLQMHYFLDNYENKYIMNNIDEAYEVIKLCLKDES